MCQPVFVFWDSLTGLKIKSLDICMKHNPVILCLIYNRICVLMVQLMSICIRKFDWNSLMLYNYSSIKQVYSLFLINRFNIMLILFVFLIIHFTPIKKIFIFKTIIFFLLGHIRKHYSLVGRFVPCILNLTEFNQIYCFTLLLPMIDHRYKRTPKLNYNN